MPSVQATVLDAIACLASACMHNNIALSEHQQTGCVAHCLPRQLMLCLHVQQYRGGIRLQQQCCRALTALQTRMSPAWHCLHVVNGV